MLEKNVVAVLTNALSESILTIRNPVASVLHACKSAFILSQQLTQCLADPASKGKFEATQQGDLFIGERDILFSILEVELSISLFDHQRSTADDNPSRLINFFIQEFKKNISFNSHALFSSSYLLLLLSVSTPGVVTTESFNQSDSLFRCRVLPIWPLSPIIAVSSHLPIISREDSSWTSYSKNLLQNINIMVLEYNNKH